MRVCVCVYNILTAFSKDICFFLKVIKRPSSVEQNSHPLIKTIWLCLMLEIAIYLYPIDIVSGTGAP